MIRYFWKYLFFSFLFFKSTNLETCRHLFPLKGLWGAGPSFSSFHVLCFSIPSIQHNLLKEHPQSLAPGPTRLLSESLAIPERHQVTAADQRQCPPPAGIPEVCLHRQVKALLWRRRRRNEAEDGELPWLKRISGVMIRGAERQKPELLRFCSSRQSESCHVYSSVLSALLFSITELL